MACAGFLASLRVGAAYRQLRISDQCATAWAKVADRHSDVRACLEHAGERHCTSRGADSEVAAPTPDNTATTSRR